MSDAFNSAFHYDTSKTSALYDGNRRFKNIIWLFSNREYLKKLISLKKAVVITDQMTNDYSGSKNPRLNTIFFIFNKVN